MYDYCEISGCTEVGYCCGIISGPTPTPGKIIIPQPYVKPIFRVLLDTNYDNVGDQLIYTNASPACPGSHSLANLFSVTLTRPDNLCSGAAYTVWTKAFHQDCFLGPDIFYTFSNSPCSQDPANGNTREYYLNDSNFTNQFDIVGYGGTGNCNGWDKRQLQRLPFKYYQLEHQQPARLII
jgi:hypothetical protein